MKRPLMISACVVGIASSGIAYANSYSLDVVLGSRDLLGDVINAIQAGGQVSRDVTMVNTMLPFGVGSVTIVGTAGDDSYYRSGISTVGMPLATEAGAVFASAADLHFSADGLDVELTLWSGFTYLGGCLRRAKWWRRNLEYFGISDR
ncbi:MAG: hypothetical protein H7A46_03600 [Verrucomicrobiales bacterium]|nr:hypothetical protein [Verrucomicrobiales bacterium]